MRYRKNLELDPAEAGYAQFIDLDLFNYVEAIGNYEFPIVFLSADLDIEAVANIFTKINTTGLKLSAFDLCVATLYPTGIRLREKLDLARERDGITNVDDDGTNILQTVALLAGKPPKKAALPKTIGREQIDGHWDRAISGLLRAAERLSEVGIVAMKDVPYDALVPPLGAVLETVPTPTTPPDKARESRLVGRWVLQSAFQQRYNEGQTSNRPQTGRLLQLGSSADQSLHFWMSLFSGRVQQQGWVELERGHELYWRSSADDRQEISFNQPGASP